MTQLRINETQKSEMKNDEINLEGMFCILAKKKKRKKKKVNAMGPFFDVIYLFLFLFF